MDQLTKIVHDRLAATTAITDIVGTNIFAERVPQSKRLPAISISVSGKTPGEGTAPIATSSVRVNSWGKDGSQGSAQARTLGEACSAALDGHTAVSNGTYLRYMEPVDYDDIYDDEVEIWGVTYLFDAVLVFT